MNNSIRCLQQVLALFFLSTLICSSAQAEKTGPGGWEKRTVSYTITLTGIGFETGNVLATARTRAEDLAVGDAVRTMWTTNLPKGHRIVDFALGAPYIISVTNSTFRLHRYHVTAGCDVVVTVEYDAFFINGVEIKP